MFFQPHERIEEICVRLLGKNPGQSAKELHNKLGIACTLQAVYKELSKLVSQGILVRKKQKYYLQASWVLKMHAMAMDTYSQFLNKPQIESLLPPEKTTYSWKFRSLIEADDFWGHLLVLLLNETNSNILFEFVSHPWFELIHHHKENLFRDTLRALEKKIYMILADDSYLTRRCLSYWTPDICKYAYSEGPFDPSKARIIDVIGPFSVDMVIPLRLQRKIEDIFTKVNSSKKLDPGEILEVFRENYAIKLSIRSDETKAKRLRKKFIDYFGITKVELGEV